MQEITGAKPVRDASFKALKAFLAMRSIGIGGSSVQFRVGAPAWKPSQSSHRTVSWGGNGDCDHFIDASLNSRYADVAETDSVTSVIND